MATVSTPVHGVFLAFVLRGDGKHLNDLSLSSILGLLLTLIGAPS